jgi:hypothetical protein
MEKGSFFKGVVFLASVFVLSGCDAEVDTYDAPVASISSNYSANYSESSNSNQFTAYFIDNDDGSSVEISGGNVQIDGLSMSQQLTSSSEISYWANTYAPLGQMHEFYFQDDNGNGYTNDFYFPSLVEAVSGQSEYASLENGYSVSWYATGSVSYNDTIKIILQGANGQSTIHSDVSGYMNGTTYFSPTEIAQLGNLITLQFCHQQQNSSIQSEDGGILNLNSCSRLYPVTLEQ